MKPRHPRADCSIIWQSRQLYRGCAEGGIFRNLQPQIRPVDKTLRSEKKIAIRWQRARSWRVHVRGAHGLEAAEI
jgi:hypothetical protein